MGAMNRTLSWLTQRHVLVTLFYCYAYVVLGCMISSLGPALPEIANRTNVSLNEGAIGALTTARSVGYDFTPFCLWGEGKQNKTKHHC